MGLKKAAKQYEHEISSNDSSLSSKKTNSNGGGGGAPCSPILQPSQMTHTSLIQIEKDSTPRHQTNSLPRTSNPIPNLVQVKSAVPSLQSQRFVQQRRAHQQSKQSDEVSSSSKSAEDLASLNKSHLTQKPDKKTLYALKQSQLKDEDIPFYEHLELRRNQDQRLLCKEVQNKKPGSKANLTYQMVRLLGETNQIVILVMELWHYLQKIHHKQLATLTRVLRVKYEAMMAQQHTRIIVAIDDDEPKFRKSIKYSGVRKDRKTPMLFAQEVSEESKVRQPNQRGRPQMSKPCQPVIPEIGLLRNRQHNKSQQPITPGRIEKSLLLANTRRLDVSAQQVQQPTQPFQLHPKIQQETLVKNATQPIIIEEICFDEDRIFAETLNPREQQSSHLFVLVHGFQGLSNDMQLFKRHLQVLLPKAIYLISKTNEKQTDLSIETLGRNLSDEVKQFIGQYFLQAQKIDKRQSVGLKKLTFIGHSLGGIIIRAALKHLDLYKAQMFGYISLGSPHLGYMYNSSTWVDAGMWFLKKFTSSISLQQLSMTDASDQNDTFLYRLSQDDGMQAFKYVVLVSSFQDSYAPYDSARIQVCTQALEQQNRGGNRDTYLRMAENILASLNCQQLVRLDVNFKIEDGSFGSMIGRTAHIQMIESEALIQALIHKYRDVFQL